MNEPEKQKRAQPKNRLGQLMSEPTALQPFAQFSWPIRVYYEDTDLGGIVYYANYLKYLERARTEFLRSIGLSNRQLLELQKGIFVVTECQIKYLRSAHMDDELLACVDRLECKRVSAKMEQTVRRGDEILIRAKVEFAFVGALSGRPVPLPAALQKYSQSNLGSDSAVL